MLLGIWESISHVVGESSAMHTHNGVGGVGGDSSCGCTRLLYKVIKQAALAAQQGVLALDFCLLLTPYACIFCLLALRRRMTMHGRIISPRVNNRIDQQAMRAPHPLHILQPPPQLTLW